MVPTRVDGVVEICRLDSGSVGVIRRVLAMESVATGDGKGQTLLAKVFRCYDLIDVCLNNAWDHSFKRDRQRLGNRFEG